jgi:K+-sensing histidine kinase KdpD
MLDIDRVLRGQLGHILNARRVLQDTLPDALDPRERKKCEKELAALNQSSMRLLRMSNNLRDMARFLRGEEVVEPRTIDFAELCSAACAKADAAAGGGRVAYDGPESGLVLNGDGDMLERVIYNLLVNALRREEGTVRCVLRRAESEARLHIYGGELEDTESAPETGLELGLGLCALIVGGHNGKILPSSGIGGVGVAVSLPLAMPDEKMPLAQPRGNYTGDYPIWLVELSDLPLGCGLYGTAAQKSAASPQVI